MSFWWNGLDFVRNIFTQAGASCSFFLLTRLNAIDSPMPKPVPNAERIRTIKAVLHWVWIYRDYIGYKGQYVWWYHHFLEIKKSLGIARTT